MKVVEWVEWVDEDDEEIRLLGVGESFLQGGEPNVLAQPGTLRVPETFSQTVLIIASIVARRVHGKCIPLKSTAKPFAQRQDTDLFVRVHGISILVSRRGRSFSLPNDWPCGESTGRVAAKVELNADEI